MNVLPIDLTKVFPATGGLPLKQRAPERQAYRLQELTAGFGRAEPVTKVVARRVGGGGPYR